MKLLSLVVSNHRSFRDEFFFDLTRPSFKSSMPSRDSSWEDVTYPVALMYGANASGKTSVVRALMFIWSALRNSSGTWLNRDSMMRDPFKLDHASREGVSSYSIDFVMDGIEWPFIEAIGEIRYHYEFEVSQEGVIYELLQGFFSNRATTILENFVEDGRTHGKLIKGLGGRVDAAPQELLLSRALRLGRPGLAQLAGKMLDGIEFFEPHQSERNGRLNRITRDLSEGDLELEDLLTLARVADIGITAVSVEEEEVNPEVLRFVKALLGKEEDSSENRVESHDTNNEDRVTEEDKWLQRSMRFKHQSVEEADVPLFTLRDESDGTLAWLAIAVSVVKALREGGVLVIDELDTSLHPYLAVEVARLFQDREVNRNGAQLIFTTHETSFLTSQSELGLEPGQVWFVEKNWDGASSLYSLRDFKDIRKGTNMAKQLLEGRYGAVPRLAPALFSAVVNNDRD